MREIKFRGKSIYSGKIIFGDLSHYKGGRYIDDEAVYENSVAQLLGYDKNGEEVYEGDKLVDSFEQVWSANVYCGAENNDDWTYYTDLKNLRLKKE